MKTHFVKLGSLPPGRITARTKDGLNIDVVGLKDAKGRVRTFSAKTLETLLGSSTLVEVFDDADAIRADLIHRGVIRSDPSNMAADALRSLLD